jgi:hypothetical protein
VILCIAPAPYRRPVSFGFSPQPGRIIAGPLPPHGDEITPCLRVIRIERQENHQILILCAAQITSGQ